VNLNDCKGAADLVNYVAANIGQWPGFATREQRYRERVYGEPRTRDVSYRATHTGKRGKPVSQPITYGFRATKGTTHTARSRATTPYTRVETVVQRTAQKRVERTGVVASFGRLAGFGRDRASAIRELARLVVTDGAFTGVA
jgi:hypothetical protein